MPGAGVPVGGAPYGGFLLVLAVVLPMVGLILMVVVDERHAERIGLATLPAGLAVALAILGAVLHAGQPLVYLLGGWKPPLGLALRADGFSAAMIMTAAIVVGAAGFYARESFQQGRTRLAFWMLLLGVWSALNAVFVGGDLFNLFVALELLTFSAVPLVCLSGRAETMAAALRYLVFALLGSVLYLLGAGLFYGTYGTLDIVLLAERVRPEPVAYIAAALMTVGLLAKTALFPLHLWLPPAHAGAPPAASAVLSALVVKASFFLVFRLWFSVMPGLTGPAAGQVLAALGTGAILFGSVLALRQARLKMLIAYSTVAQIGYLFFVFPLAANPGAAWNADAIDGGIMQTISHAFAKAAMFMAAGLIGEALGHDRIADLRGIGRALPVTVVALGVGGLSLMGVPPTGGYAAKWLLMKAAVASGQWWWALVMLTGGVFAGGYLFRVLAAMLAPLDMRLTPHTPVPPGREAVALALAVGSVVLGLLPLGAFGLFQIGRPAAAAVGLH